MASSSCFGALSSCFCLAKYYPYYLDRALNSSSGINFLRPAPWLLSWNSAKPLAYSAGKNWRNYLDSAESSSSSISLSLAGFCLALGFMGLCPANTGPPPKAEPGPVFLFYLKSGKALLKAYIEFSVLPLSLDPPSPLSFKSFKLNCLVEKSDISLN